ncbi:MAG: hypothetical protein ACYDDF_08350 [Thermoplasmatota archaeon]
MRKAKLSVLLVALLAGNLLAPLATASTSTTSTTTQHAPYPILVNFLQRWYTDANMTLNNGTIPDRDYGDVGLIQAEALRDIHAGIFSFGMIQIANLRAYSIYINDSLQEPKYNGTYASDRANRLYYTRLGWADHNRSVVELAAARQTFRNFTPHTGQGLEYGILAAGLLMTAQAEVTQDFPLALGELNGSAKPTEPDITLGAYRDLVHQVMLGADAPHYLLAYAAAFLAIAQQQDKFGPAILTDSYNDRINALSTSAANPQGLTAAFPDLVNLGHNASVEFKNGETLLGFATMLILSQAETTRGLEALLNGDFTQADLSQREAQDDAQANHGIDIAVQEGFSAVVLRDAVAYANSGKDTESTAAQLEPAINMQGTIIQTTAPLGPSGTFPLVALVGVVLVAGVAVGIYALRKR